MIQHCPSRCVAGLFLVALLTAGAAQAQDQKWKFVVFGDTINFGAEPGINTNLLSELAVAIVREKPNLVLFAGDVANAPSSNAFAAWTNIMTPVYQAGISVFPTMGNHDTWTSGIFEDFFGAMLPTNGPPGEFGSTYALSHGNALILMLNEFAATNDSRVNQAWLDAVLSTNKQPHLFAVGHLPAFKVLHDDCLADYPTNRDVFWNTLSNAHCRFYVSGHDHFYDHTRLDDGDGNPENDLHQFIVGTGGAPLYGDGAYDGANGLWTPVRLFHEANYGYLKVEINGAVAGATWCHRTGVGTYESTTDTFAYSVMPRPAIQYEFSADRLTLTWSGTGTLQAAPASNGSFTNVPGAISPFVISQPCGTAFYRLILP